MFNLFKIYLALALLATPVANAAPAKANGENSTRSPKHQLSVIVLAGVAGAVMGLSTLSFYGRPQEKLSNIAVGAAVGIIGGAIFTTIKAATEPRDFYNESLRQAAGEELLALQQKSAAPASAFGVRYTF